MPRLAAIWLWWRVAVVHRITFWAGSLSLVLAGAGFARGVSVAAGCNCLPNSTAVGANGGGNIVAAALTLSGDYTPPVSWTISAGTLPAGLVLDAATGRISGTPTVPGTSDFTISATDNGTPARTASSAQSILVAAAPPMAILGTFPAATIGVAYSTALPLDGTYTPPVSWAISAGSLPDGFGLDTATGVVSGMANAVTSGSFTLQATDHGEPPTVVASPQILTVAEPAPFVPATWSETRIAPPTAITLSNGDLTATGTDTGMVLTDSSLDAATANNYWEVHIDAMPVTHNLMLGISPSSEVDFDGNFPGYIRGWGLKSIGDTYANGERGYGFLPTFGAGDTVKILLKQGSLYFGLVGGAWTGDPIAGTGTWATGISGKYAPGFSAYQSYGIDRIITVNFGATPFLDTPPAGARGWPAAVPMGLEGTLPSATLDVPYYDTIFANGFDAAG